MEKQLKDLLPAKQPSSLSRSGSAELAGTTAEAELSGFNREIARAGMVMGITQHADHVRLVAQTLYSQGWTLGDIARCVADILTDPELMRSVRFAGAITTEPFALWRQSHTPASRLLCADCGAELPGKPNVTIGGVYRCEECFHKRHAR